MGRVFLSADGRDSVTEGTGLALPKTLLHLYRLTENLHSAKTRGRVSPAWVVNESEKSENVVYTSPYPESNFDETAVTL